MNSQVQKTIGAACEDILESGEHVTSGVIIRINTFKLQQFVWGKDLNVINSNHF